MWILDALSEVSFRKPFLIFFATLGAGMLLLAYFFSTSSILHPALYALIALDAHIIWQKKQNIVTCLIVPAVYLSGLFLLPAYVLPFCVLFSLIIGKIVFAECFRLWKWPASSALVILSIPVVLTWQSIPEVNSLLPYPFSTLLHAAVFAFCLQFSLLPYQIRKDSVLEAFSHYSWGASTEALKLAEETTGLYTQVKQQMKERENNAKLRLDLEEYTERVIHQCFRLQQIGKELVATHVTSLDRQIEELKQRIEQTQDFNTRLQYEQTLSNKQKQKEQYEALQVRQDCLRAQILNFISSLENVRFAYANQDLKNSSVSENIEMFMDVVRARAEGIA